MQRIVTNGRIFKVQKRFLFIWWDQGYDVAGMVPGEYSFAPYIFSSLKEAQEHIARSKKPALPTWTVIEMYQ